MFILYFKAVIILLFVQLGVSFTYYEHKDPPVSQAIDATTVELLFEDRLNEFAHEFDGIIERHTSGERPNEMSLANDVWKASEAIRDLAKRSLQEPRQSSLFTDQFLAGGALPPPSVPVLLTLPDLPLNLITCKACHIGVKLVLKYVRFGLPISVLQKIITGICSTFIYRDYDICAKMVADNVDTLYYVVLNSPLTEYNFCALVMSVSGIGRKCGIYSGPPWSVLLPPMRRKRSLDNGTSEASLPFGQNLENEWISFDDSVNNILNLLNETRSDVYHSPTRDSVRSKQRYFGASPRQITELKVLHLTDIHFDPLYRAGTTSVCEAPICCQTGTPADYASTAKIFGMYQTCDTPKALIESMMGHIAANHKDIDYIMHTGDMVAHDIWRRTVTNNLEVTAQIRDLIKQYFPGVPVYSTLGNHEVAPLNLLPPPEDLSLRGRFSTSNLIGELVNQWESLLPAGQTLPSSAKITGSYSILVRPGFRIISINSNYCYKLNWWVPYKSTDPGNVLSFLSSELKKAETNNELVHIIGHIASLDVDCYEEWTYQFSRIVTRFSHLIMGQFYGHQHQSFIRLQYSVISPNTPIGVQYLTPNNGPYYELNPSYTFYYIEGDHANTKRSVLNYETYYMNLTEANLSGVPNWKLLVNAKQDFGLASLEPAEWERFIHRLKTDENLFNKYFRIAVKQTDAAALQECTGNCRNMFICDVLNGDEFLPKKCL